MSIRVNASTDLAERTASVPPYLHTNLFTMMVWFKLITNRGDYSTAFSLGNSGAYYAVQTNATGNTLIFWNAGVEVGSYSLTVGTWYHICLSHDASSTNKVYVDGTLQISDSSSNDPSGTQLDFGNDPGVEWADCELRGGRCWTTGLTQTEIAAEKASTTVVKSASLWADWDMPNAADAGSDRSGNSRPLSYTSISDGASDPAIYASAPVAVSSRRGKSTIHPGKHPDRFGRHLRTKRNRVAPSNIVTGTLAVTLGSDTLAAAGTPTITGTAAVTLGNDTLNAVGGGVIIQGSRRAKIPNHPGRGPYNFTHFRKSARNTATIATPTTITGTLAVTLGNDTLAAQGSPTVNGSLAKTLGNDTLSAAGGSGITGTLAVTLGNDTLAASGKPTIIGTLAVTLGSDTLAASGSPTAKGSLAVTLGGDTLAAQGSPVDNGSLAKTLGNDNLAAAGWSGLISGTLNDTLGNDTLSAFGSSGTQGTATVTANWVSPSIRLGIVFFLFWTAKNGI